MFSTLRSALSYYINPNPPTPPKTPNIGECDVWSVSSSNSSSNINKLSPNEEYFKLSKKIEKLKEQKLSHIAYGTGVKIKSKTLKALEQTLSSIERKIKSL
ncbi:MAG: hypothetical protein JSS09_09540 [Verrucomicrobia bacterium]|nr:hypothetical protein [Verrucomicrobiota bacterium]